VVAALNQRSLTCQQRDSVVSCVSRSPDALRTYAQRGDFSIGSAMSYYLLGRGNPRQYVDIFTREFNN